MEDLTDWYERCGDAWICLGDSIEELKAGDHGAVKDVLEQCAEMMAHLREIEALLK